MSNNNKALNTESIEWVQAPHPGALTKPGLEGAACYGARVCVARPQRQVGDRHSEFGEHLEASQEAVRSWLSRSTAK